MKKGDRVEITKTSESRFMRVGDAATLRYQDSDGDWWAYFADDIRLADHILCIEKGFSECKVIEEA